MDARRPCPDSALLAAFLDGTLAEYERAAVVSHLAECPACRAVAIAVVELHEVEALDALWEQGVVPPAPPRRAASAVLRWSRLKTRAPAVLAAAVVLVAVLATLWNSGRPSSPAPDAVAALLDTAEGERPTEARLSGMATYAPPPTAPDASRPRRHQGKLIAAASHVRRVHERDDAPLSRRAVGVAALLTGELDEAIATLEVATLADDSNARLANDLAAAYYERAVTANRADDLPAALSAAERSLRLAPTSLDTLFNRALIISAMGLRREAMGAWHDYIARDPSSEWTAEARRRLEDLPIAVDTAAWTSVRRSFERTATSADAELAVRYHASAAREYLETQLLSALLAAIRAGDESSEALTSTRIARLADAFGRLAGDYLYLDLLRSVERGRREGREAAVLAAHAEYLAGLGLMARQQFAEAAEVLEAARQQLAALDSPLSLRASIEIAANDYFERRFDRTWSTLERLKPAAHERRHTMLTIRALWLQGMASFASNDFGRARVAYEEMLAATVAYGDTDTFVMANVLLANLHDTLGDSATSWRYRVSAASRLEAVFSQTTLLNFLISAAGDAQAGGHHSAALLFQSWLFSRGEAIPASLEVQARAQRARSLHLVGRWSEAQSELEASRQRLATVVDDQARTRVEADVLIAEAEVASRRDPAAARIAAQRALALPVMVHDPLRRARVQLHLASAARQQRDWAASEQAVAAGLRALDAFRASPSAEFAIRASDPIWGLYEQAAALAVRRGDLPAAFAYVEQSRMRTAEERRAWSERAASITEVQQSLAASTALLVLTQLDDQLLIWAIRSNALSAHTVNISAARAAMLVGDHLREMVGTALPLTASAELFDHVFKPAATLLSGVTSAVVVADAPYNRIAFAGLWDRTRNRFVIEDHSFMLAPNATALVVAGKERHEAGEAGPPARRHAAILEGPAPDRTLRGRTLATLIRDVYGAERVSRNGSANADHFMKEVAGGDIVHVAARVIPNNQFPSLSRVQLAESPGQKYSGAVYARSLGGGTAGANLVALENGADGQPPLHGDGTANFARALLAAGIPHVVSPVTHVEARSVERTWLEFHRHYAAGIAASESLRRAQLVALSESQHRPGPWAMLAVFGSAQ